MSRDMKFFLILRNQILTIYILVAGVFFMPLFISDWIWFAGKITILSMAILLMMGAYNFIVQRGSSYLFF